MSLNLAINPETLMEKIKTIIKSIFILNEMILLLMNLMNYGNNELIQK
jgi:hypothetical protein